MGVQFFQAERTRLWPPGDGRCLAGPGRRHRHIDQVLVDDDRFEIIRRRQTLDDVLALET